MIALTSVILCSLTQMFITWNLIISRSRLLANILYSTGCFVAIRKIPVGELFGMEGEHNLGLEQ